MKENSYIDNCLINLKRQYSKDEALSGFIKKIKELEFDNGSLKAEVNHLQHQVNLGNKRLTTIRKLRKHRDSLISELLVLKNKYKTTKNTK